MSKALAKTESDQVNLEAVALSPEARKRLQVKFKRASDRARAQIVTTWHLQGLTEQRMADLVGVPVKQIKASLEEAVEEARAEMHLIPEGPMLMSQIVAEGYGRLNTRLFQIAHERISTLLSEDRVDDDSVQAYMRLLIEINDKMADRMERLGFTTAPPRPGKGAGGVRPGPEVPVDPVDALLHALGGSNRDEFEGGVRAVILRSSEPSPAVRDADLDDEDIAG